MKKLRKILYRSFEEPLGSSENGLLEAGLNASEELRKEKRDILKLRENLSAVKADFSFGFEQKVMNAIRQENNPVATFEILPVFRTVAFSGLAAILIVLVGVYFTDGSLNIDSIMGISKYAPDLGLLAFL
ncbi:MAG: hypothetical protein IH595_11930 [Bacteroidales bacterium]|nr:hypothetical protein [Bacteroidales bacterium]